MLKYQISFWENTFSLLRRSQPSDFEVKTYLEKAFSIINKEFNICVLLGMVIRTFTSRWFQVFLHSMILSIISKKVQVLKLVFVLINKKKRIFSLLWGDITYRKIVKNLTKNNKRVEYFFVQIFLNPSLHWGC